MKRVTSFDVRRSEREGRKAWINKVEPAPHSAGCQRGQTRRMPRGEGKLMRGSASGGFPLMSLAKQYRRLYFWLFHKGGRGWRGGSCYFSSRLVPSAPIVLQLRFNCNVCYKGRGFGQVSAIKK